MKTKQRFCILVITICLGVMLSLTFLLTPGSVRADVGVHPVLPGGSSLQPEGDTPIQMASEIVTMTVRLATQADNAILSLNPQAYGLDMHPVWYPLVAEVQADFHMLNPTTSTIDLVTWFPLASALEGVSWELNPNEIVPRIASFQVAVNAEPLDYSVEQLPNPKGTDKPALPWASFKVTYTPGQVTNIHVSYLVPLTQAIKSSEYALYYVFQTGSGWAGPIGQADLVLNLPYPASEATLQRVSPQKLSIPYPMSSPGSVIPSYATMQGNQARWTWTDFEPTPQDDFAIWLVDPGLLTDLEAARAAVQVNPQDGQAWLDLASLYYQLSTRAYFRPSIFSQSYRSLGLEAYQKAAELWPEHPAPHVGLALLTLSQYMTDTNATSEALQYFYDQMQIARDLELQYPELAEQGGLASRFGEDALGFYFYQITATANFSASSTAQASQTQQAATLLAPTLTPTPQPTHTPTLTPALSPSPQLPSPSPASAVGTASSDFLGRGLSTIVILGVSCSVLIILFVIGLVVFSKRSHTAA